MACDLVCIVDGFVGAINLLLPTLGGVAMIIFFWGAFRMVTRAGDTKRLGADKTAMLWGLVAMFVLFSIWGILRIMQEALLPASVTSQSGSGALPVVQPVGNGARATFQPF